MTEGRVPESLLRPAVRLVWEAARSRLDRFGSDRRGTLTLDRLPIEGEQVLTSLLGRVPKRLDLAELEAALQELGLGRDLDEILTRLGVPPSPEAARKREDRASTRRTRAALRAAASAWSEEWAPSWLEAELSSGSFSGLEPQAAVGLLDSVRTVLAAAQDRAGLGLVNGWAGYSSRTDLAARVLGSAHALDSGSLLERMCSRALHRHLGADPELASGPSIWEQVGFHTDLVSFPVLTWGLVACDSSPLAGWFNAATKAGLPVPVTQLALRQYPIRHRSDCAVLVVENPRLVEMAAERRLPFPVVTTNGNPRRAPTMLVEQLTDSGVDVRYHGDFDSAGLGICRSMVNAGCRPLRMDAADYIEAIELAERLGVGLPVDDRPAGATPWDLTLREAFNAGRSIVHEETFFVSQLARSASIADLER